MGFLYAFHNLQYIGLNSSVNYYIKRKGACCNVSSKFFFSARPINIYRRASWLSCRRPLLVPTFQSYFLSCSHPILSFTLFPHSQDISTPWNISKSQNIFVLAKYFYTIPISPPILMFRHSQLHFWDISTCLRYFCRVFMFNSYICNHDSDCLKDIITCGRFLIHKKYSGPFIFFGRLSVLVCRVAVPLYPW